MQEIERSREATGPQGCAWLQWDMADNSIKVQATSNHTDPSAVHKRRGTQAAKRWGQAAEAKWLGCVRHRERTRSSHEGKWWWSPFLSDVIG